MHTHLCTSQQDIDSSSTTIHDLKRLICDSQCIPIEEQRLVCNGSELRSDAMLSEYDIRDLSTVHLLLRLCGGRLHGQILQKSLLYMRPRGYMGMKNEKLHCLMMTKLVNTRQIHLLTLVKYFYARMALFHYHPQNFPHHFRRMRGADMQRRPFLFPRQ